MQCVHIGSVFGKKDRHDCGNFMVTAVEILRVLIDIRRIKTEGVLWEKECE